MIGARLQGLRGSFGMTSLRSPSLSVSRYLTYRVRSGVGDPRCNLDYGTPDEVELDRTAGRSRSFLSGPVGDVTVEQVLLGFQDLTQGVHPQLYVELGPWLAIDLVVCSTRRSECSDLSPK